MAKIRNVSGEPRLVPWLGGRLILDKQIVEIPDEDLDAYTCQPDTWAEATPAKSKKGDG